MIDVPPGAFSSPSTARNRDPILEVLRTCMPASGTVLEIAAGAGEHAIHFATAFPGVTWQPTDPDERSRASIAAWRDAAALPNLASPLALDAADPERWPLDQADAVVNINMIHISPWTSTQGLMAGAGRILPAGGLFYLYGPYLEEGIETAESNLAFDRSLKSRNPEWGLRRLEQVQDLARQNGLDLRTRIPMPANNLSLIFRKM